MRTLFSGVSRGTEALVFRGGVPVSQHARDAGPVPGRRVPGAGEVRLSQRRPWSSRGRRRCAGGPCSACTRTRTATWCRPRRSASCRTAVPPGRAVLAGAVETALNALWDAGPLIGDRIAVLGAGMVGCCVARLLAAAARRPGCSWSTPTRPGPRSPRRSASRSARPDAADGDCDLVLHASATAAGLSRALELLGAEGEVIELSWFGDRAVPRAARRGVPLPTADHPGQPGRHGRPGPARPAPATPTGWPSRWACSPTPRSTP